jgi:DNA-binding GntR family transcriptional regulator
MRESKRGAGHEAILNALVRRDGLALAHSLRTHLRDKHEEVIRGIY